MERTNNPNLLDRCGWLLKELEQQMKWKATNDSWTESTRDKWISDVNSAVHNKQLHKLYDLARDLENKIQYAYQSDEWKNWKREYWQAVYMGTPSEGVDTPVTVTQFTRCLIILEESIKDYSSHESTWKESRRSEWLQETKKLIVPVENIIFGTDVLNQIEKCISNTTISQWGRNVDKACSKLNKCADVLDKVTKDAGIAKATGGGAAIGGGLLALGGLIAAPFTAGASLAATAAGTALAVGGGVTSFSASMVKHGWDKSQSKEGEQVTKTVCKQAQILSLCLTCYCDAMQEFQKFLDTPEGMEVIAELKSIDRVHTNVTGITIKSSSKAVSLGLAGLKFKDAVKIMHAISILRPSMSGPFANKLATAVAAGGIPRISVRGVTLFSGVAASSLAAKALTGVGAVLGIGFGIWDVVSASNDLKNGNEIASNFRKLARDLKSTKNTICAQYESLVGTN